MHFGLDEEQQELASTLESFLGRRSGSAEVRAAMESERGFDESLWRSLSQELGVAALHLPEEVGGVGFSLFETQIVLERLGYALTPSPLFGSSILAGELIRRTAPADRHEELLAPIAAGEQVAAAVWATIDGHHRLDTSDVLATREGDTWTLDGAASLVQWGDTADTLVVVARLDAGLGVFVVDPKAPGVNRRRRSAVDPTLRFADVSFNGATADPLSLDAAQAVREVHSIALAMLAGWQVGTAQRALDMTVEYAKTRMQFGRTIGSFQALKHRMADMLVSVEQARSAAWSAAWDVSHDIDAAADSAIIAKTIASDALTHIAGETIQLHGGIGITWEHDSHLIFKRAHATGQLFGAAHELRSRLLDTHLAAAQA